MSSAAHLKPDLLRGGAVAEWIRGLNLKSGGPWFKSCTLLLSGFILNCPEFNSSTMMCKEPTGQPPTSWDFYSLCSIFNICLFIYFKCPQLVQQCYIHLTLKQPSHGKQKLANSNW